MFDQILKIWVKTHMLLDQKFPLLFDNFLIHFLENNGAAFGILEDATESGKIILTLFRIIVVIIGIYYVKSILNSKLSNGTLIALGLIIGGAIGNIIDSTFYGLIFSASGDIHTGGNPAQMFPEIGNYASLFQGKVVDMLSFPLFTVDLPNWLAIPIPFSEKTILSLLEGYDRKFTFFAPIFNIADAGISVGIFMILFFYRKEFS